MMTRDIASRSTGSRSNSSSSTWPRITVIGERSSWLASSRNWRCVANERSIRSSISLNAVAMREASSSPRTGIRRVRSVAEIVWAVSARWLSGRKTRPARAIPISVATMIMPNWTNAWVRTASSISLRSSDGKLAATNSASWPLVLSGTATYRAKPASVWSVPSSRSRRESQ